ncbi:hypothetical protein EG68_04662 [Paragonimus skrjabini miyazakii]|uniref:DUF4806 domain-containing protein n=1 Tax=Paragonimus skrjabini miyazakii TaxID=59628 RepID=A0A8S9YYL5_9TREM|nr:hypothetical protein EG68_04662 [Paragonimus skrjabini miyazakii]
MSHIPRPRSTPFFTCTGQHPYTIQPITEQNSRSHIVKSHIPRCAMSTVTFMLSRLIHAINFKKHTSESELTNENIQNLRSSYDRNTSISCLNFPSVFSRQEKWQHKTREPHLQQSLDQINGEWNELSLFLCTQDRLDYMTLILKNILMYVHQTSAQQATLAVEDHLTDKPQLSLPLRSRTHYMLMEKRLHSTKYFNDLVSKLTRIEGRDANEVVQHSLIYLVNNELATKISWSGANGKLPIYNARLLDVIRQAVLAHRYTHPINVNTVDLLVKRWFHNFQNRHEHVSCQPPGISK